MFTRVHSYRCSRLCADDLLRAEERQSCAEADREGGDLQSKFEQEMSGFMKLTLSAKVRAHCPGVLKICMADMGCACRTKHSAAVLSYLGSTMVCHPQPTSINMEPTAWSTISETQIMIVTLTKTPTMILTCNMQCCTLRILAMELAPIATLGQWAWPP